MTYKIMKCDDCGRVQTKSTICKKCKKKMREIGFFEVP